MQRRVTGLTKKIYGKATYASAAAANHTQMDEQIDIQTTHLEFILCLPPTDGSV